ncbi:hypothetical protein BV20DRAFT_223600 [Pilatotrama ljubarskyi]|nr:hypothetical protein BV20DRAFT_223600 [Pilatotrama ljubarskyi]
MQLLYVLLQVSGRAVPPSQTRQLCGSCPDPHLPRQLAIGWSTSVEGSCTATMLRNMHISETNSHRCSPRCDYGSGSTYSFSSAICTRCSHSFLGVSMLRDPGTGWEALPCADYHFASPFSIYSTTSAVSPPLVRLQGTDFDSIRRCLCST